MRQLKQITLWPILLVFNVTFNMSVKTGDVVTSFIGI